MWNNTLLTPRGNKISHACRTLPGGSHGPLTGSLPRGGNGAKPLCGKRAAAAPRGRTGRAPRAQMTKLHIVAKELVSRHPCSKGRINGLAAAAMSRAVETG